MIRKIFSYLFLPSILVFAISAKDWQNIQEESRDAVVHISVVAKQFNWHNPYIPGNPQQFYGTGFFIDQNGTILTCSHVIEDAFSVFVTIPALGKQFLKAHVIGLCPEHDVALLQLDDASLAIVTKKFGHIPQLTLGDSDFVKRGEDIIALGYPGTTLETDQLKGTVGVISARLNRVFQTDVALNPGNSGGPVIDRNGMVIGIASSSMIKAQNSNFAVPINTAKSLLTSFHEYGLIRAKPLGVVLSYTTPEIKRYLKLTDQEGCLICDVHNSPADFQVHDIVYKVNGYSVDNYGDMGILADGDQIKFDHYVAQLPIGHTVTFDIYRNGQPMQLHMVIQQGVESPIPKKYPAYEKIEYEVFAGMVIMPLTSNYINHSLKHRPGLQRYLTNLYAHEPRLVIANLIPDSYIAHTRTISWGDTINEINGEKVYTLDDFRKALQKSKGTGIVVITVTDEMGLASQNLFNVLSLHESCQETVALSQLHGYPLSPTMLELMEE